MTTDDLHVYVAYLPMLREREAMVLRYRHGNNLEAVRCHTLAECAAQFNVSSERIRQMEARGIRALESFHHMQTL